MFLSLHLSTENNYSHLGNYLTAPLYELITAAVHKPLIQVVQFGGMCGGDNSSKCSVMQCAMSAVWNRNHL